MTGLKVGDRVVCHRHANQRFSAIVVVAPHPTATRVKVRTLDEEREELLVPISEVHIEEVAACPT